MASTNGADLLSTSPFSHSEVPGPFSKPKAIITGGRVGLGYNTARALLARGFDVVITGRDSQSTIRVAEELGADFPGKSVTGLPLELSDLSAVRSFVAENTDALSGWTHLVNNAGAKIEKPFKRTTQGHEWHFGVNHLSHHLLTSLLLCLESDELSRRVVFVSSIVAKRGNPERWSNLDESASAGQHYANSKLANLASMLNLNQRVSAVTATAAHPGFARAEPYGNALTRFGEHLLAQSAARGSEPITAATLGTAGGYWGPNLLELWGKPAEVKISGKLNQQNLEELWRVSNALTGATWN